MLKFIFSCLQALLFCQNASLFAQSKDSLSVEADSLRQTKTPIKFDNIYAGPDLLGPIAKILDRTQTHYSFLAETWTNKTLGLSFSAGYQCFSYASSLTDIYTYSSRGGYVKAVGMKNFLSKVSKSHKAYFGLGIGSGLFSHQMDYSRNRPGWSIYEKHLEEKNVGAVWSELSLGFRVKVLPKLGLGYEAVLKKKLSVGMSDELSIASIPGYGKNAGTAFSARYFIFVAIGK